MCLNGFLDGLAFKQPISKRTGVEDCLTGDSKQKQSWGLEILVNYKLNHILVRAFHLDNDGTPSGAKVA